MNATQKNMAVLGVFFALILWMAVYYSTVLQKRFQMPLSYSQSETGTGEVAGTL